MGPETLVRDFVLLGHPGATFILLPVVVSSDVGTSLAFTLLEALEREKEEIKALAVIPLALEMARRKRLCL